jgi:hypothetical protein
VAEQEHIPKHDAGKQEFIDSRRPKTHTNLIK